MEKIVFKKFMDNGIIQKTVIFADAFNLNIDKWRPANNEEHPYRINFYNGNMPVGYIDAGVYVIGSTKYVETDMPFVLFTPFGKIAGYFSTHEELFKYGVENRKEPTVKLDGLFKVKKYGEYHEKYYIASTWTLKDLEKNRIRVSFNNVASNYSIDIRKETATNSETAKLNITGGRLTVSHYDFSLTERRAFANIEFDLEEIDDTTQVDFRFLDIEPYQKRVQFKSEVSRYLSYHKKLGLVDFDAIAKEIAENDSRMFSFIDEVRDSLTLLANGITPISIYDKIAQLCFHEKEDQFKLAFTRARNKKTALAHNLVLKRMDSREKIINHL